MKRIVIVEKKRLLKSLTVLFGIVILFVVAFIAVTVLFIQDVKDLGTWDVLTLFWEDRAIIADYWVEALSTFWLEVPTHYVYFLLVIILVSCIMYYKTRERRTNLKQRQEKLASYEKSSRLMKGRKIT